ncbi:MAG: hypothetical protein D6692_05625 [Planctomycetota bacterium]|nr:MAG: hypothetical protein D6692_05625 [Planctomycetota bacterium]
MTLIRRTPDPVRPSTPDPVDAWLDVLVAMLSIPKADRQRVRDELEDHLRSRIDDLLIHGLTEPQALEKAVAELGETADLARQLSHAHKPPRTRRYAMHALIIALTGTVVALGVNTMRPNAGLPTAPGNELQVANVKPERSDLPPQGVEFNDEQLSMTALVPVNQDSSFAEVLQPFAESLGLQLDIDQISLSQRGLTAVEKVRFVNQPERSLGSVLNSITHALPTNEWHKYGEQDRVVAARFGDRMFVTTRAGLDRRSMTRHVYSLASFSAFHESGERSFQDIAETLANHASPEDWEQNGGDLAVFSTLGSSLIVTAPIRIHGELQSLLDDLAAEFAKQEAQRARMAEEQAEANADAHGQIVSRIKHEYELAVSEQVGLVQKIDELSGAYARAESRLFEVNKDEQARNEMIQEMARIRGEKRALEIRLQEATARVDYLLGRMIEIEYEPLVRARDSSAARNPNVQPGAIEIRGEIARAGIYDYRLGQTLSRMLVAAGGLSDADSKVQLLRGGKVIQEWSAEEATSGPGSNATLLPGDTIAIVD